ENVMSFDWWIKTHPTCFIVSAFAAFSAVNKLMVFSFFF
ncbi:unnamed protein product, partial [marine sediment metagenome]